MVNQKILKINKYIPGHPGKIFIFFIFILVISIPAILLPFSSYQPIIADPLTEPWRWSYFPELAGKGVYCMTQDRDGRMWFGTDQGVLSYDGLTWKQLLPGDSTQIIHVIALGTTRSGEIYAGDTQGVYFFKHGKWKRLNLPLTFNFSLNPDYDYLGNFSIIEASDGSIWIGSVEGALQIKDKKFTLYSNAQVLQLNDTSPGIKLNLFYPITFIYEDRERRIWFGSSDGKIIRTDIRNGARGHPGTWQVLSEIDGFAPGSLPKIFQSRNGDIWVINENFNDRGVNVWNGSRWKSFTKTEFGGNFICHTIIETQDGKIWVGGYGKIHIYNGKNWQIYEAPKYKIPANQIYLHKTLDGGVWIAGLRNDVARVDYSHKRWVTYKGLNFQLESSDQRLWFLTWDKKIVTHDPKTDDWTQYDSQDGLIDAPVRVLNTRKGDIYAAGSTKSAAAVAWYNGGKWRQRIFPKLSSGIDYRAITETQDGAIWFGALELMRPEHIGGALRFDTRYDFTDASAWRHFSPPQVPRVVQQIVQTRDGQIWFGCYDLFKFEGEKVIPVTEMRDITKQNIHFLFRSQAGELWISCRGYGILSYNGSEWRHYDVNDGLASNSVYSIAQSPDGQLWINTEKGISVMNGGNWISNVLPSQITAGRVEHSTLVFTPDKSLWINNTSRDWLWNLAEKNNPETMAENFYTIRYHPDLGFPRTHILPTISKVDWSGNITVAWQGMDPWNLTPQNELLFSFQLDDQPWSTFSKNSYHTFLSLPPGHHSLKVQAQDQDLNIEPTPATIRFYVSPPLWRTPWFFAGIFVVIAAIISFFITAIKQKKLDELKLQLFSNVSHEIRTPLTLIKTPVEELLSSPAPGLKLKENLALIHRNTERLLALVTQLLDLNKIESGNVKLELALGELGAFLIDFKKRYQQFAARRQITFTLSPPEQSQIVLFDQDKLAKIIDNLLINAFKYTPEGGQVTLSVAILSRPPVPEPQWQKVGTDTGIHYFVASIGRYLPWANKKLARRNRQRTTLQIKVSDTGPGMMQPQISNLFKRYYGENVGNGRLMPGAHIGLAYTGELVKLHQGQFFVDSVPGKGTTFWVLIPIRPVQLPGAAVADSSEIATPRVEADAGRDKSMTTDKEEENGALKSSQGKKSRPVLLIVEDEIEMQMLLRSILSSEYHIFLANDGREGHEKARAEIPDVIISDIMMADMDGIELVKRIKGDALTCHIPFIFLTARDTHRHKMEGLRLGAEEYLSKPFHANELRIKIKNLLKARERWRIKFGQIEASQAIHPNLDTVDAEFLQKLITVIEQNIADEEFDYTLLLTAMHLSRRQLFRKVKAVTGCSCNEFIRITRLRKAADLLRQKKLNITEIAYEVGFREYSYFAKHFKKFFGTTPKEYRQKNQ